MTNYERIKKMSLEEMAEYLADKGCCNLCSVGQKKCLTFEVDCECSEAVQEWLESEVQT